MIHGLCHRGPHIEVVAVVLIGFEVLAKSLGIPITIPGEMVRVLRKLVIPPDGSYEATCN